MRNRNLIARGTSSDKAAFKVGVKSIGKIEYMYGRASEILGVRR